LTGAVPFAVYRIDSGLVVSAGGISGGTDMLDAQLAANLAVWGGEEHAIIDRAADPDLHYVGTLAGRLAVLDRPAMQVQVSKAAVEAGGVDESVLTGLPDPCTIVIDAPDPLVETTVQEVEGGGFVFAAADPGTYVVEVRHFPFLPYRVEITAT
jgi:hypothetical protein